MSSYESMKVGQLRALCKSRGLNSDGMTFTSSTHISLLERKEDLIAALFKSDAHSEPTLAGVESMKDASDEQILSAEDLKEIATLTDEMRHLRRQWLLQASRQTQFVHQGYGSSRK